jgi:hypothetical protein
LSPIVEPEALLSTDWVATGPRRMPHGQTRALEKDWYDGIAHGVRLQRTPDDEGGTWVLFLDDDRRPVNAMALPAEELGPLELDGLAKVVDDIDAPAVIVAVPRSD